ncbi:unnamed protein product [Rotaria sp. Silwood1]|nr:unnamed protein product [Rotaria sp. Silwood1]CAF1156715.1 unnamed protein product [Rotaria sp. Silwood1]CAF3430338.1 unnamed protein product [Rotaria sp. Silwood1]CAF4559654.1 unnamed protein product [Rotaria sp. Silwood1]CAF4875071.1 unnamed protein product [Rotaria sp. Silwood1]
MIIKNTHGYLGCPDNLVPCLNKTHCINVDDVCIGPNNCVDEQGKSICQYCPKGETDLIACVTHIETELSFECLSPHQICDTKKDCHNNEDEHSCGIKKCQFGFSLCANGSCIETSHFCDGKIDCADGHDERHCSHLSAIRNSDSLLSSKLFICSASSTLIDTRLISYDYFCDGYKDCPLGDDEKDCTDECTSSSQCIPNANVTCIQHRAVGKLCRCQKQGYRLTNNSLQINTQICQDFNECNDSLRTYCSFNCLNTDGSFNCTCPLGFTIDEKTKTCRKINDQSKPDLLIVFDNNIIFYNISNATDRYSSKLLHTIDIEKNHHLDCIQYDSNKKFIIYYNQKQNAILCFSTSNTIFKPIILISNVTVHGLSYNENEKTLFIIENQSQTLRMYTPITCDISISIKMHSWQLNNIANSIQSIEIDAFNRQIIFASHYEFLISNMSKPNSTKVLYTTDREIKRFIYDASFKRIFWTVAGINNNNEFPVYTCDGEFKRCHDTSIRLPFAWPFTFLNDGLLYSSSSLKSLDMIQLYGNDRFSNYFITSTRENIRSFLLIDYQSIALVNLCMNYSTIRCKNKVCLQINSTEINCLSIDENIITKELIISTTNTKNSTLQNETESLIYDNLISEGANRRKHYRYRPSNTMLFCIIIFGVLAGILALFAKYCQVYLNKKALSNVQNNNEQYLSTEQPNLDEFTVTFSEQMSEQSAADNVCNILIDNDTVRFVQRRRDSV